MKNISLRIVLAASAFALPGFAALGCGGKKLPGDGNRQVIATFADCTVYAG